MTEDKKQQSSELASGQVCPRVAQGTPVANDPPAPAPDLQTTDYGQQTSSPPSRIVALDLARGLAILFMVMVHILETYSTEAVGDSPFGWAIQFLGSPPAAPVFMFLMGASMAFSSRQGLGQGVRRGLWLLFLAYALNFCRAAFPMWLAIQAGFVTLEEIAPATPAFEFLTVDILHLAGLSFVVCVLLRRCCPKPVVWLALSVLSMLAAPRLWGVETGWPFADQALRLIGCGDGKGVAFGLFPWITYPLGGMAFGHWLKDANDRAALFRRGLLAGLLLLAVGTAITLTNPDFHIGDYYRSGPGAVIWITGFVFCWLWLCFQIAERVAPNPAFDILFFWSKRVTRFYFIHWVIIGWGTLVVGYRERGYVGSIIAMVVVALLADQLTRLYGRWRGRGSL